jgi:NTP pyrophosphatase (non-canonical NTP hydrolase)
VTTTEYEKYVNERSRIYDVDFNYAVVAINEEAGEIAGFHKKYYLRKNPTGQLTLDHLKGECGDVLFYLTRLVSIMGWTLSDIMEANKEKLDIRHEQKFRQVV